MAVSGNIHIPRQRRAGFTFIEIIAILIILGIVSATLFSRFTSPDAFTLSAEATILKGHLRYAQAKALSDDEYPAGTKNTWGITFTDSTHYTLQKNGASASAYLPGEGSNTHALQQGSYSWTSQTITFNNWGTPIDSLGNALASAVQITLTQSGVDSQTVTVTKNTGFIP